MRAARAVWWPVRLSRRAAARAGSSLARWGRRGAGDVEGIAAGLVAVYDDRPGLRRQFPMAFVEEHDAPAFLDWVEAKAWRLGFPPDRVDGARRLLREQPTRRIAEVWRQRPDLRQAFPDALDWPGNPAFVRWLRDYGLSEHGVPEDWILWFERSLEQHVCRRLLRRYQEQAEWRERHPWAFTSFGAPAFVTWLRETGQSDGLNGQVSLCPAASRPAFEELRLLHQTDSRVGDRFPDAFARARETDRLLDWVQRQGVATLGLPAEWVSRLAAEVGECAIEGATVVGLLHAGSGMGQLARSTLFSLQSASYRSLAVDLAAPSAAPGGPPPFTIVHANAAEVPALAEQERPWRTGRALIGYLTWEQETPPPGWRQVQARFELFDEVWTTSRFSAAALAPDCPVPVQVMWPSVPDLEPATEPSLGGGRPFTFLFLCDLLSQGERKNPLGLLEAFRRAFRKDDGVRLVLKIRAAESSPEVMARLASAAEGLPVSLLTEHLPRSGILDLLRQADAYASLHRAEGFGFTLAEAMLLGKPVVATHYSGNLDFMTPANSFLVPCRLIELAEDAGPYRRGSWWADPDLEAAADLLRRVRHAPEAAREVALRGQREVSHQLSPQACGERMSARLRLLARRMKEPGQEGG